MLNKTVVLSGASGFVGGRLLQELGDIASEVRCLSRSPGDRLRSLPEVARGVQGDLMDPASLEEAFKGADIAYYLVHSLSESGEWMEAEIEAAENFAKAAAQSAQQRERRGERGREA